MCDRKIAAYAFIDRLLHNLSLKRESIFTYEYYVIARGILETVFNNNFMLAYFLLKLEIRKTMKRISQTIEDTVLEVREFQKEF